jgi:hypothetical protein
VGHAVQVGGQLGELGEPGGATQPVGPTTQSHLMNGDPLPAPPGLAVAVLGRRARQGCRSRDPGPVQSWAEREQDVPGGLALRHGLTARTRRAAWRRAAALRSRAARSSLVMAGSYICWTPPAPSTLTSDKVTS